MKTVAGGERIAASSRPLSFERHLMIFHCESFTLASRAPIELIDVSERVKSVFERHPVRNGQVTVSSSHTTAFVTINEREPGLQLDMLDFLARLAPPGRGYRHDRDPVDGRPNAHSHLLGLFMTASQTLLVSDGHLLIGDWQSVFFVELDGPRAERWLRVQVAGEA